MTGYLWKTAVFAVFLNCTTAFAQDVILTARDGGITLSGVLQGFDGEFYRLETKYGLLTVDGQGVLCDGPGCPDLTSPKAVVRFAGAPDAGLALLPPLLASFAASRGLGYDVADDGSRFLATITDLQTGEPLAEFSFDAMAPEAARRALGSGRADLVLAAAVEPDFGHRALALDALLPIAFSPALHQQECLGPDCLRAGITTPQAAGNCGKKEQ